MTEAVTPWPRPPKLHDSNGTNDIVDLLRDQLERARRGELTAVALVILEGEGFNVGWAYRDDMEFAWARITAGVGSLYNDLQNDGL